MPDHLPENLLNLPALPGTGEVEELVFDGEVVEEAAAAPGSVTPAPVRAVVVVVRVIVVVVRHEHTRAVARHAAYIPAGAVVLARRRRHGRTLAGRMAQQLALQGDTDKALTVLEHDADERRKRHERRIAFIETAVMLAKNIHWIAIAAVGVMLALGIALGDPAWPFGVAEALARNGRTTAIWALRALFAGGPVAALLILHRAGSQAGGLAPGWSLAAKPGDEGRGLVVTADGIVLALQNTPVPALKKAFKDGWKPSFQLTPIRDGEGYSAVFSTPMGVTANDIADQVEVFARNLHRAKVEVWATDAERAKIAPAGYVSLWVANPGILDRPAPEYPLLHEGQADVFTGVPGGVTARGDGALVPVAGKNMVVGGQMGEGKSNTCRVFLLGCCTDPLCEVDAFVFANNGDFDAFAPRLANYFKGTEDDTVAAAVNRLQELYEEVGRREGRLAELGAKKLTRRIAGQHPDMRPIVSLYSECHELFGHPEYGELAGELAVKIAKRARKTGIVLVFDTQSSRKSAIPPALVELMSVNACFYVKKWQSNDGFLGDGSFQSGVRATELRPGRDRGRSVVTGTSDAQFELLKWYFIVVDDDTGYDAAAEVIDRCMKTVAPGTRVSGGGGESLPVITVRDLLDDLDAVIREPHRVSVNDLPHLLKRLDRTWPEYRALTGRQLRRRLTDLGVKTTNTDNKPELDPAELHRVIAVREESA